MGLLVISLGKGCCKPPGLDNILILLGVMLGLDKTLVTILLTSLAAQPLGKLTSFLFFALRLSCANLIAACLVKVSELHGKEGDSGADILVLGDSKISLVGSVPDFVL